MTTASGHVYRTLVEHANDGIAVVQDASFVFGDPSVVAMSGRTADEFVGLHISQVFHPGDLPAAVARFGARMRGEPAENRYEIRIRRPDGETRWGGISLAVDRRHRWVNRKLEALLGWGPGELVGQSSRVEFEDDAAWRAFGDVAYPRLAAGQPSTAAKCGCAATARACRNPRRRLSTPASRPA